MPRLATIGYADVTQGDFLERLRAAGIGRVIDVRALASSRRPGFAKTALAAGLAANGIGYTHMRALGTPKEGRLAARAGDRAGLAAVVNAHLDGVEAQAALAQLAGEAVAAAREGRPLCLLCLERAPRDCHRSLVAERVAAQTGLAVDDLFV